MTRKDVFRYLASYQRREKELEAVAKVWERLSARERAIILVTAGVWDAPNPYGPKSQPRRSKKGETPAYLLPAMNLLKESDGQLTDREIARRVGVANSTLVRNETYMRARQAYRKVSKPRKVLTIDPRVLSKREI
jgi:hypothetical protein